MDEEGLFEELVYRIQSNLNNQLGDLLPDQVLLFQVLSTKKHLLNEFIEEVRSIQNLGDDDNNEEVL